MIPQYIRASNHGKWHRVKHIRDRYGRKMLIAHCGYAVIPSSPRLQRSENPPSPEDIHNKCRCAP